MIPSTSVQIHSSEASSAAARIDAEKSDPPRPSVVGRPSAVAPLKPVTTGTTPLASRGRTCVSALVRVASMIGVALPNTASVTITSAALTAHAGMPAASRYSAIISAERRSPIAMASSTERGGRSPSMSMPCAMRRKSAISSRMPVMARPQRSGSRSNSWHVFSCRVKRLCTLDSIPASSPASACRNVPSSRSVTPDIAETTASTGRCCFCSRHMAAATRIRSAEPMLVPPNFITSKSFIEFVPGRSRCDRE